MSKRSNCNETNNSLNLFNKEGLDLIDIRVIEAMRKTGIPFDGVAKGTRGDITTYTTYVVSANVLKLEVGTNGYHGGDGGHGGRTFFTLEDEEGTCWTLMQEDDGWNLKFLNIVLQGDCELGTFISVLKLAAAILEAQSKAIKEMKKVFK